MKEHRIEFRVTDEEKRVLERAAALSHASLLRTWIKMKIFEVAHKAIDASTNRQQGDN
jgi:uncharacterized protein (DUF1778 family)